MTNKTVLQSHWENKDFMDICGYALASVKIVTPKVTPNWQRKFHQSYTVQLHCNVGVPWFKVIYLAVIFNKPTLSTTTQTKSGWEEIFCAVGMVFGGYCCLWICETFHFCWKNLKQPRQTRFLFVLFGPHMIGSSARMSWPGRMSLVATMNRPNLESLSILQRPVAARSQADNTFSSLSRPPPISALSTGSAADERS